MTTITLYTGGGVSLSPVYADGRRKSSYVRLIADDGKAIQKGEIVSTCVDVLADDVSNWAEIDAPAQEDELTDDEALAIILGGDDA